MTATASPAPARRIALVGTAPSARGAPFSDPSWDIWGVGNRADYVTRATRWYELHRLDGEGAEWAAEWRRLMKAWSGTCEIWMFYPEPDLGPRIVAFDAKPLTDRYGTFFMTSSFSWMMAQAIHEIGDGPGEIGLWGVDMEYGTEYREQRVGLRHFIEVAKLAGITVTRVASSGIAYEPIPYPFWQDDPLLAKAELRRNALREAQARNDSFVATLDDQIKALRGAGAELDLLEKAAPRDLAGHIALRRDAIDRGITSISASLTAPRADILKAAGALHELAWLTDYLKP